MLGERADFEFRCFNNVNRFRNREIPCRRARRTFRLRIPENTHITSNTHPRPFSQCSPHRLFGGGGTSRSRSGACRGWITVFARMYVLLRPSAASRAGLAVSHLFCLSEAGRATLFVYRVGHAVPSAFVSDAVSLCSVCCLTSSPASPRRLDRSAAPVIMSARPRLPRRRTPSLPRAPFSPNTYPAWGAEHPRTGARRAP